jgi:hypothetical protein
LPGRSRDLGRGGAQHTAVQQRIKHAAETLGFRAVIEKEILDGKGSIDICLERLDQTIACEISITTTIDHEVGNVSKCLKAGFSHIAIVCLNDERLKKIATAVAGSLGADAAERVIFIQPDPFIDYLKSMAAPLPSAPEPPQTRRGYKVKRSVSKVTLEEQKQREGEAIRSIAETMRRDV